MHVKIRQAKLEDKERIARFLRIAYKNNAQYRFPKRWEWEFTKNPFWDGEYLPIWLAEVNEKIVGQTCEMIVPLQLGEETLQAAWGVDFIVLPEYRRQGIGRLLLQAHTSYHGIFLAISMSDITRKVLLSLGLEESASIVQLYKTIRFTHQESLRAIDAKLGEQSPLSRMSRSLKLGRAIAAALNLRIKVRDAKRLRERTPDISIDRVERFDSETDQLWHKLAPYFPAIVRRDSSYLNWKFVKQPHMDYDSFVAKRASEVCGFVVTRQARPPEPNLGAIVDVFAAPDDESTLSSLLVHATHHLARKGVQAIIAASSVPSYVSQFEQIGFVETDRVILLFGGKEATRHNLAGFRNSWFLSMGDHDWDQYPWSWL